MDIARSTLYVYVANLGAAMASAAGLVYFSRALGASRIGIFFLFQALLQLLVIPADFGLRGAVEKRISEGRHAAGVLGTAIGLKTVLLGCVVFCIGVFEEPVNTYLGAPLSTPLAVGLVLQEAGKLLIRVLKGELRVAETAILKFARRIVGLGTGVVFVAFGLGVRGVVYGFLIGLATIVILGAWKVTTSVGRPSVPMAKSLLQYSRYNFITSVNGFVFNWVDITLIGLFLTQAHVGAYEVSWRVMALVLLLSKTLAQSMFPQISEWSNDGTTDRIERLLGTALTPSLFLILPAFFGTALFGKEILQLVFGQEFGLGATAFVLLMGYAVVRGFGVIYGRALDAMDHVNHSATASVVSMLTNVVLNVVLISSFGLAGAAAATVLAALVDVSLKRRYLARYLSVEVPTVELAWCLVASVAMTGCLFAVRSVLGVGTLPKLVTVIALGVVVYGILVLLIRPLRTTVVSRAYWAIT